LPSIIQNSKFKIVQGLMILRILSAGRYPQ
jgi:hypothetical protein